MGEPQMPNFQEEIKDPIDLDNREEDNSGEPDASKNGSSEREQGQDESDEEYEQLVQGWKEDREEKQRVAEENRELRNKLSKYEADEEEDEDEYEGLTEKERIDRIIEKRTAESKRLEEAELKVIKDDIRFHERTDKYFKENKKGILALAEEINAVSLDQAIKVHKRIGGVAETSKRQAISSDQRRREANGVSGGGRSGQGSPAKYDREKDQGKSISALYAEAGAK